MVLGLTDRLRRSCPYPLPSVNASWRTSTVVAMARGIAAEGAWDRLPILADALQDAGCEDHAILQHLRGTGTASKRCTCSMASRRPWGMCGRCRGTGAFSVRVPVVAHEPGKFPDRNGGCWEGTCWVVEAILQREQKVVARYEQAATPRYAPVLNPGSDVPEHRVWIVVPHTWVDGPEYAVEAESPTAAEEELIDDDHFGKHYRIARADIRDYIRNWGDRTTTPWEPDYSCSFTRSGKPYDSEDIHVYGSDRLGMYNVLYLAPGLPYDGVCPLNYGRDRYECVICGKHYCGAGSEQVCSHRCLKKHDQLAEEVESDAT